jgi:hypothetical protein
MMSDRIIWPTVALLGFALGGCEEPPAEKRADSPYFRPPTPAEAYCDRQGFMRGTNEYDACMARQTGTDQPLPPVETPPAGVVAFKDEYGNMYDGQGNRVDTQGRILAPPASKR